METGDTYRGGTSCNGVEMLRRDARLSSKEHPNLGCSNEIRFERLEETVSGFPIAYQDGIQAKQAG
jgi:hypothetical protein